MILSRAGREYAHLPYTADADMTGLDVEVGVNGAWYDADDVTLTEVIVLVAGPDAAGNPDGTIVLRAGVNRLQVRFPDNPEIIIRDGGVINVVDY